MRALRLDLEYDGAGFHGWSQQPGLRTVEGELRRALDTLVGAGYELAVAGRTDTGVHATGQVASVRTETPLPVTRVLRGLNGLLPEDVSVREVVDAAPGFDARRDAVGRAYEYRILLGPPAPLRRARALYYPYPVDVAGMRAAAAALVGEHEFGAFTPTDTRHVHFTRTIFRCEWEERDDELVLCIEADAFLRHMVRTIVGSMLLVGRGRRPVSWIIELLARAPRSRAGSTLPAHALTLVGVRFDGPRARWKVDTATAEPPPSPD